MRLHGRQVLVAHYHHLRATDRRDLAQAVHFWTFFKGLLSVEVWRCPKGNFERNIDGHGGILNCSAMREEDGSTILVAGADNGQLHFWDWRTGHKFQTIEGRVQPGSLEAENAIFACTFDKSYSRLLTAECDKTIKVYKEDEEATPETHPLDWKAPKNIGRF